MCNYCDGSKLFVGGGGTVVGGGSVCDDCGDIRPSLKRGLCMSALMSVCLTVCLQSLRLAMSASTSFAVEMGNQSNDG